MSLLKKIFSRGNADRILIIDPVESAAYNRRKFGVNNFAFPDVESALLDIFQRLASVSQDLIETITQIIVINPGNEESEFTEERKKDFFNKLKKLAGDIGFSSKGDSLLEKFQNCIFISYTNDVERINLLDRTRKRNIVFFDFTLSRAIINHLHVDPKSHNIFGYGRIETDNDLEKIEDVQKYINIAYVLTVETITSSDDEERLKRVRSIIEEHFERFLSIIKANTSGKYFIIMGKESIPDFHTLRQALNEQVGSFHYTECPPESFEQLPEHSRVFIKDVHKLHVHKLFDLCSLSLNKDNKDKLIILHSTHSVKIDFPEFYIHPIYSLKQADEVFQKSLDMQEYNKNIITNLANDLEQIIRDSIKNQSVLKRKLNELDKLKAIEKYADFKKFNYWYKLNSLNFPTMDLRRKFLLEELEKYFNDIDFVTSKPEVIEFDWIKFEHQHKKADWEIFNKKGKRFPKQPYMGSKGIKYMAMLAKNYKYPSEISIDELVKKVNDWNKDEDNRKYKTPIDKLVNMYIRTDLEKIDKNLLYLHKDFKTNDPCYYDPETDLTILIYDEDFPS